MRTPPGGPARGRGGGFRPLKASLEHWTPGGAGTPDPLHVIAAAWPGIVGHDVAANAHPLEISGTALVIGTRSSAWSQQLQFLSLAILAGLQGLSCGQKIERLIFRTGIAARRTGRRANAPAPPRTKKSAGADWEPAASLEEAFLRLRARMSAKVSAAVTCQDCEAAIDAPPQPERRGSAAIPLRCAPCTGAAQRARSIAIERIVYMAPWLGVEELRAELPGLGVAEFERARKALLSRWWSILERARRAGHLSANRVERHVGSSYVLLQSRLPPDRITPAVVRNLLGVELEALLWPRPRDPARAPQPR